MGGKKTILLMYVIKPPKNHLKLIKLGGIIDYFKIHCVVFCVIKEEAYL